MNKVWVELRYGAGPGVSLCRVNNPYLLRVFKECALGKAKQLVEESAAIDEIIHLQDQAELERLEKILTVVIPNDDEN